MSENLTTILITGASSGIGAALALHYAAPSVQLHLLARREDKLAVIAQQCRAKGALVSVHVADVRSAGSLAHLLGTIDSTTPVDIVFANAGVSGGSAAIGVDGGFTQDLHIFDVNVFGVLHSILPLIPRMIKRRHGHVVLVSSVAGFVPLPSAPAYAASKAAIRFYGDALISKLRPFGVKVSVICPGFIVSEMTDQNDFPMPFLMGADAAAARIARAVARGKSVYVFPKRMAFVVSIVRFIPSSLRRALFHYLPQKKSLPDS